MTDLKEKVAADRHVDTLYAPLRTRYRGRDAKANGYVSQSYFRREQEVLLSLIDPGAGLVVDVGCGSGMMVQPLVDHGHRVVGIDFNEDACRAAAAAGVPVIRGDAYNLPLAANCAASIINTQFLNQQPRDKATRLVMEIGRALAPGGLAVIVWRNGPALIHRVSLVVLGGLARLRGLPAFPMVDHDIADIVAGAERAGLVLRSSFLSFAPWRLRFRDGRSLGGRLLGASCYAVLTKPHPQDEA